MCVCVCVCVCVCDDDDDEGSVLLSVQDRQPQSHCLTVP